ncbi:MAG: hypothetical protein II060_13485 [Bacteroidales bacterium]|nr:hypothetical protein [Bacteroidales bacterium]
MHSILKFIVCKIITFISITYFLKSFFPSKSNYWTKNNIYNAKYMPKATKCRGILGFVNRGAKRREGEKEKRRLNGYAVSGFNFVEGFAVLASLFQGLTSLRASPFYAYGVSGFLCLRRFRVSMPTAFQGLTPFLSFLADAVSEFHV